LKHKYLTRRIRIAVEPSDETLTRVFAERHAGWIAELILALAATWPTGTINKAFGRETRIWKHTASDEASKNC
jgi:hypothetical protein